MADPLARQPGYNANFPPAYAEGGAYPNPMPQPGVGFQAPAGGFYQNVGYQPQPQQQQYGYQPPQQYIPPGQPGYNPGQGYVPPGQGGYQPPPQMSYVPPGYTGDQPIAQQPQGGGAAHATQGDGWMNIPQGIHNVPPGLEYLTTIDQLLVHQKVELLEAFTGFETKNKYTVKNTLGQKVFYAVEDSDCCTRNCCGPNRPFDMKILDNYKTEIIHLNRPLACTSCCFPCCLQTMEVSSPPGTTIGSIEQEWSILTPQFRVKNAAGDVVLRIEGPFCTFSLCGDVEFKLMSKDGATQVGKISKQWSGLLREAFTDADFFGINFPMDLDVRMKAVMLGACFLIDFMFFEKSGNQERDRPGMF